MDATRKVRGGRADSQPSRDWKHHTYNNISIRVEWVVEPGRGGVVRVGVRNVGKEERRAILHLLFLNSLCSR